MSLKTFHVVFITASVLLSLGVAYWGAVQNYPLYSVLSVAGAVGLVGYEIYFIQKTKS